MKAKEWTEVFSTAEATDAVGLFLTETVSLAASRGKSDAAVESAVREQKTKLRAAGLDPDELDDWLKAAYPDVYERYRRAHGRRSGYIVVHKLGLAGKPARPRSTKGRRKSYAVR